MLYGGFIARRGKPDSLFSGNGKQFTSAKKIVDTKFQSGVLNLSVSEFLFKLGISWNLITKKSTGFL